MDRGALTPSPRRLNLATERFGLLHQLREHRRMPAEDALTLCSCRVPLGFLFSSQPFREEALYFYALAVKEPLGTWALVLWGLALAVIRHPAAARPTDEATLLLPAGVLLAFVSSQDGFNHHMRYVLPLFPFLAVATSKRACFLRPGRWSAASSLAVFPHSMSYFNEAAGGPERWQRSGQHGQRPWY
jgi:hypothetical protein